MKPFGDWVQEIAERNNMEPEPDPTDSAADGSGYASAHYGYTTCPHCGYDVPAKEYIRHVADNHGADLAVRGWDLAAPGTKDRAAQSIWRHNELLRKLKND